MLMVTVRTTFAALVFTSTSKIAGVDNRRATWRTVVVFAARIRYEAKMFALAGGEVGPIQVNDVMLDETSMRTLYIVR